MKGQRRIEQMYAYVVVDEDGTEGVPAFAGPRGEPIPMVGADWKRAEALRPMAEALATMMDKPVTLCRFEVRTEVETIEPRAATTPRGDG